jgi:oxygen-independent coproporphyrinogen-3 oxidase
MDREILKAEEKESERIMIEIRMPEGIAKNSITGPSLLRLESYLTGGQISQKNWEQGRISLTLSGRLRADRIVREILL